MLDAVAVAVAVALARQAGRLLEHPGSCEDAAAVLGTQAAVADGQAMLEALERYEAIGASWCVARASARLRELDESAPGGSATPRTRHRARSTTTCQRRSPGRGSSQEPFDVWFRESVREVHGINLEDGFPPPEQLLEYRPRPATSL
jgi:hypothetical protein